MDRRGFIAALALAASGCLGRDDADNNASGTDGGRNRTQSRNHEDDVLVADRRDAAERFSELVGSVMEGEDGDTLTGRLGEFVVAGVVPGLGDGELRGGARVDEADDGAPLLRTVLMNSSRSRIEVEAVALPPYDGVAEPKGNDAEDRGLRAIPTSEHDLFDAYAEVSRGDAFHETVAFEPRSGYVGEYEIVGEDLERGVYVFEGPDDGLELSVWRAESPGPDETSRFDGETVPDLPGRYTTSWYHEADESTPVYIKPSEERLEAPATVEFTLVNHSNGFVSGNPEVWDLYKLTDGDWYQIAPWAVPLPFAEYPPGERATDAVRLLHGAADEDARDGVRRVDRLGGGTYAYSVGMRRNDETNAALFELEAPPAELVAPEDATVERDDGRVVVTPDWRDNRTPNYEITVRRSDTDDGRRVLTEQLYRKQYEILLYSVPLFDEGVDEVVFRGSGTLGILEDNNVFVHDGQAYEVTVDG